VTLLFLVISGTEPRTLVAFALGTEPFPSVVIPFRTEPVLSVVITLLRPDSTFL